MKRLIVTLTFLILITTQLYSQNDDKATRTLSEQQVMNRIYETTNEAIRVTTSGKEFWILDSLVYSNTEAGTDSVFEAYIDKGYSLFFMTISDSGSLAASGGLTDSVKLEGYDSLSGAWYEISGYDKKTDTLTSNPFAPGSGITMSYKLTDIPYKIRATLLNHRATNPERRLYISFRAVKI